MAPMPVLQGDSRVRRAPEWRNKEHAVAAVRRISEVRSKARVVQQRAEILGLITRLRSSRPSQASGPEQPGSPRLHPVQPMAPEATPATSLDGLRVTVQALAARLSRVEEQLNEGAHAGGLPPPTTVPDATFSGVIKGQLLSDMLQLVSSNQMSGIFEIESEGTQCSLYFHEGRIRHAEGGELTGEEAFFAAFAVQSGRYRFKETTDLTEKATVSSSTQFLVLEALRRMDEVHGGG